MFRIRFRAPLAGLVALVLAGIVAGCDFTGTEPDPDLQRSAYPPISNAKHGRAFRPSMVLRAAAFYIQLFHRISVLDVIDLLCDELYRFSFHFALPSNQDEFRML